MNSLERIGRGPGQSTNVAPFPFNGPRWLGDVIQYLPAAGLLPAGALGAAALAGRGPRVLREHKLVGGLLVAGAAVGLAYWQLSRFFTEQPDYTIEGKFDGFEIRRYHPRVVAETTVAGAGWDEALDEGFRRLAGYIFGGNAREQKLAMTAPVNAAPAQPEKISEKIAMTAPVTARSEADAVVVTFTMPKGRDLASLPAPADRRIRLREHPGGRVAALKSRGRYTGERIEALQAQLLEKLEEAGLTPRENPSFAGYDAPSTLPFLRRLEIWVPIA
jgi:hypothetical protein